MKYFFVTSNMASQWPFEFFFQKVKITPYLCMESNALNQEGSYTKGKLKLSSPNFQKSFPKLFSKSIENFVGAAWLIWMPRPLFKNRSDLFGSPCIYISSLIGSDSLLSLKVCQSLLFPPCSCSCIYLAWFSAI